MGFRRNKTTWWNTDTRLCPNVPPKENIDRKIASGEFRLGGSLTEFLGYMVMAPYGAMADDIQELKCIVGRNPIERKRGPIEGRTPKLLV